MFISERYLVDTSFSLVIAQRIIDRDIYCLSYRVWHITTDKRLLHHIVVTCLIHDNR